MSSFEELYNRLLRSPDPKERIGLIKAIAKFYGNGSNITKITKLIMDKNILSKEEIEYFMTKVLILNDNAVGDYFSIDFKYSIINSSKKIKLVMSKYVCVHLKYFDDNILKGLSKKDFEICRNIFSKKNRAAKFEKAYDNIKFISLFPEYYSKDEFDKELQPLLNKFIEKIKERVNEIKEQIKRQIQNHFIRSEMITIKSFLMTIFIDFKRQLSKEQIYDLLDVFSIYFIDSVYDDVFEVTKNILTDDEREILNSLIVANKLI